MPEPQFEEEDRLKNDEFILASDDSNSQERRVMVWGGAVQLEGILSIPEGAHAVVVIVYERIDNSRANPGRLEHPGKCELPGRSGHLVGKPAHAGG